MSRRFLGVLLTIFIFAFFLAMFRIIRLPALMYFNSSPSLPIGFYMKVSDETPLKRGDLVILKVPEEMRQYVYERSWLKEGSPLLKIVYAIPGDTYLINSEAIFVNGKYVGGILKEDGSGWPLPRTRGSFTVRDGCFLPIAARFQHSFDGRYFGQVSQSLIIARVKPLLIFPEWMEAMMNDF